MEKSNPLEGTIRINNVLHDTIPPYGCHSDRAPDRFKSPVVIHSRGKVSWPFVMSTDCHYDHRGTDSRCKDCLHP